MEKAKYIEKKEEVLFKELDNAHKKLKEIANWYLLSEYKCNSIDEKNQKLYIQKVNNIYQELRNLLIATKKHELAKNLKELVVNDESIDSKLESLPDLESLMIKLNI
jgi:hypothetical protein